MGGVLLIHAVLGTPLPAVHDEFSYLLGAETFARGHLTEVPHVMPEHFQAAHVIHDPTYASKYPPGQALLLAAGWKLWQPSLGLALGAGLLVAAVHYLLRAIYSGVWALAGALTVWSGFCLVNYWTTSYWGGGLAATAGALTFGAAAWLAKKDRPASLRHGFLFALGLCLLAITRPFEGLLFAVPCAGWTLVSLIGHARRQWGSALACAGVIAATGGAGIAGLLLHNQAVTGHLTELPYQCWFHQYATGGAFLWQPNESLSSYVSAHLGSFFRAIAERAHEEMAADGSVLNSVRRHFSERLHSLKWFYLGPYQLLGMAAVIHTLIFLSARRIFIAPVWMSLFSVLLVCAGSSLCLYDNVHYVAPILGCVFVLAVGGLQAAWHSGWMRPALRPLALACGLTGVLAPAGQTAAILWDKESFFAANPRHGHDVIGGQRYFLFDAEHGLGFKRKRIEEKLARLPGQHLVFVKYGDESSPNETWHYNGADIAGQKVMWAEYMDQDMNERLCDEHPGHTVWVLDSVKALKNPAQKVQAALRKIGPAEEELNWEGNKETAPNQ